MNMEPKKRIFVFSGKQGSGKTTYSRKLQKYIGLHTCKIFKFAEVIYKLHDACLPILKDYGIITQDVEKEGQLLQVLGTEYGRVYKGPRVWVDATKRIVDKYLLENSTHYAIIDDCRFENEFDAFHPVAHMIRLTAPRDVRKARCGAWRDSEDHISETALDDYEAAGNFDCIIDTDGTHRVDEQLERAMIEFGYFDNNEYVKNI